MAAARSCKQALSAEKVIFFELEGSADRNVLTSGIKAEVAGMLAAISAIFELDGRIIFAAVATV